MLDSPNSDEFLEKLACLCEEYKAKFGYSHDDSGIWIELDRDEIFCGFICDEDAATTIREAKSRATINENS